MFGYRVEENFDLAKEQRLGRLHWFIGGGLCFLFICYLIHPFSAAIFQGYCLTLFSYGDSFYVRKSDNLGQIWLWKAMLATIPLHILFIVAIVWLDWAFPSFFPKVLVCGPILIAAFAIESVWFDSIVSWFRRAGDP